ncbi:MAG: HlyD family secretion protein [Gammaproteobacteria bacterium]|nr:HlyD family secretion protein [Gammaproteobacteria bacterium]MBQ0840385.1 HlyD family secretion protein [Gammaproteobacteria bacterium]
MRKIILLGILSVGVIFAGLWAKEWWFEGRFWQSTDNAYTRSDITIISAKVAGIVDKVNVSANERVKAGDILISMYKPIFDARVARVEADVVEAQAGLARVDTQTNLQKATIAASRAQVKSAEAQLKRANLDLVRSKTLKDKGYAEKQRYDHDLTDVSSAEAELARTRANVKAAVAQLDVLSAEKAEIRAEQAHAEAEVKLAKIALYLSDIRAPREGIIGAKHVERGEYIHVGARKMAIVSLDHVWVSANFKETQLTGMLPGQRALIEIDAFPGELIEGVIESLAPASGAEFSLLPADNATGNFTKIVQRVPVKILLDQTNPTVKLLRPGMSVLAKIDTRASANEKVMAGKTSSVKSSSSVALSE